MSTESRLLDKSSLHYTWKFGADDITTGTGNNFSSIARTFPVKSINSSLTVESSKGCSAVFNKAFSVGPYPKPDFSWENICLGSASKFYDKSILSTGNLSQYDWNFDTISGSIHQTSSNPSYTYSNVGKYAVKLTVTSDKGCTEDITQNIHIVPYLSISPTIPYFNDFEAVSTDWFSEGKNNSWKLGVPSKPYMSVNSNGKVWYTDTLKKATFGLNQSSFVNSPCFNIAALQKPMIYLKIRTDTRDGVDGGVLQFTNNDGATWTNIGDLSNGITGTNWYNSPNILSRPGNVIAIEPVGWSDTLNRNKGWVFARHVLDHPNLKGKSNVRFRMAFASASAPITDGVAYEGLAFDNVWIGERSRMSVIEHFLNESDLDSKDATTGKDDYGLRGVDDIINSDQLNLTSIKYHTSFPAPDKFNDENPADPSARVLFYGVQKVPYSILNGNAYSRSTFANNTADEFLGKTNPEDSLRRKAQLETLEIPEFNIIIDKNISGTTLNISTEFSANIPIAGDTALIAHIAVVDRQLTDYIGKNGQKVFESILKTMLPDAGGTTITQSWSIGTKKTLTYNWPITNISDNNRVGVVAFIQNSISKKVMQAAYNGPIVQYDPNSSNHTLTGVSADWDATDILVYPNPVKNILKIKAPFDDFSVQILNSMGVTLKTFNAKNYSFQVDVSEFPSGMFLVNLLKDNKIYRTKFNLIH